MKLWAISDLHVRYRENLHIVENIVAHPDDWLIVAGDVCETLEDFEHVLDTLLPRFAQLIWVPGNHELWTIPITSPLRGVAKYEALVSACRRRGIITPEDPYPVFTGEGGPHLITPLFLLYDYSFAPPGMDPDQARAWAKHAGLECTDEHLLHPDPYPSIQAWCAARCDLTEARLHTAIAHHRLPTVIVNHFPLLEEHAVLPLIPRFKIWCGTRRTHDWPDRFSAVTVISGHLHIRRQIERKGVLYEEVSLGYPKQWKRWRGPPTPLVRILPVHPRP